MASKKQKRKNKQSSKKSKKLNNEHGGANPLDASTSVSPTLDSSSRPVVIEIEDKEMQYKEHIVSTNPSVPLVENNYKVEESTKPLDNFENYLHSNPVVNISSNRAYAKVIPWIADHIQYSQECYTVEEVKSSLLALKEAIDQVKKENSSFFTTDYRKLALETNQILEVLANYTQHFVNTLKDQSHHLENGNTVECLLFSIICYYKVSSLSYRQTYNNNQHSSAIEASLCSWLFFVDNDSPAQIEEKKLGYFKHRDNGLEREVERLFKKRIADKQSLILFLKANALLDGNGRNSNIVVNVFPSIDYRRMDLKLLFLFNLSWKFNSYYDFYQKTTNYYTFDRNLPYNISTKDLLTSLREADARCLNYIYLEHNNSYPIIEIINRINYHTASSEDIIALLDIFNKHCEVDTYKYTFCVQSLSDNVLKLALSGENIANLIILMRREKIGLLLKEKLLKIITFSGLFVDKILAQDYCDEELALHLVNYCRGSGISLRNLVKYCANRDSIQFLFIDKLKDLSYQGSYYSNSYNYSIPRIIANILNNSAQDIILTTGSKEKLLNWIGSLQNIFISENLLEFLERCQIENVPKLNSLMDITLRSIIRKIIKLNNIGKINTWIKKGIERYLNRKNLNRILYDFLISVVAEEYLKDFDVFGTKEVLGFEFLLDTHQRIGEIYSGIKEKFDKELEKYNDNKFTSKELQNMLKQNTSNEYYFQLLHHFCDIQRSNYENSLDSFFALKESLKELRKTYQLLYSLKCDIYTTINEFLQIESHLDDIKLYEFKLFVEQHKKEIEFIQKDIFEVVKYDDLDLFETLSQSQLFFYYYNDHINQDKISVQSISKYILESIKGIKDTIENIISGQVDDIFKGINFYNLHIPTEKKFLSLIGIDQHCLQSLLDAFELHHLKQHLVDFREVVSNYNLPFTGYEMLTSDLPISLSDSSSKLKEIKQFIGEIDKSTLRVFKYYNNYKNLVEYIEKKGFTENELRILTNKLVGNEEIIQHLISAKKLVDPLLDAINGKCNNLLQFFNVLKDLQINENQLEAMEECANNLEKVASVVQSATDNIQNIVTKILDRGELLFDLDTIQYRVKIDDSFIDEKEFKNLVLTSTFQKTLCAKLELFSTSGMLIESITKIISQLRNISHVCFQHGILKIPLTILNDSSTMRCILEVFQEISKEWHRKIDQSNISFFNMKQRLIILKYLEDHNTTDIKLFNAVKHIVESHFNISETDLLKCLEEIQIIFKRSITTFNVSQLNWINFSTAKPLIESMENFILQILKEFESKIINHAITNQTIVPSNISGTDVSVVSFIDLSNLVCLEQYYYLVCLQETRFLRSSNILFCNPEITAMDIDVFLKVVSKGDGKFVFYQIERLNGITKSYLLSQLLKYKSSNNKNHIVCLITKIESISSLPIQTKVVSSIDFTSLDKIIATSFKFDKLFTLSSDISGNGKTTTARAYLQQMKKNDFLITEIHYNNSSKTSQLINILFESFSENKFRGVIFLNISEDADIDELNLFLLQLLLLGVVIDSTSGKTVCVPKGWEVVVEVPLPSYLKTILLLSRNIAIPMPIQKDYIVDNDGKLFAECYYRFKERKLNKVSQNFEEINIVESYLLDDNQVKKYILDAYSEHICKKDSSRYSLFFIHTFTKFMAKRCHYLCNSSFMKFNIINNQIPTYFEHMLNEASDFMNNLFEHNEDFDTISIYNAAEGNPIIIPLKKSNNQSLFKKLEEQYRRQNLKPEFIQPYESLKYVENLVNYIALALEIKENIVVDILFKHSYILTPHFAIQFLKIIEKISIGYPITLEGGTGTGKTKLFEVLSDLLVYQGTGRSNSNDQFPNLEKLILSNDSIRLYDKNYNNSDLNNIYNNTEPYTSILEGIQLLLLSTSIPTEIKKQIFDIFNNFVIDLVNQPFICSLSTGDKNQKIMDALSKYKLNNQATNDLEKECQAFLECLKEIFKANNYFSTVMLKTVQLEVETKVLPLIPKSASIVIEDNRYCFIDYLKATLYKQPIHDAIKQFSFKCHSISGFTNSIKKFIIDMLDNHPILKPTNELLSLLEQKNLTAEETSNLLLEFIETPMHSFFKVVLMNNAVSEDEIYLKLKKKIELARRCEEKKDKIKIVFFIDEMNTSSHMGLMKQIIYDKFWAKAGGCLPSNILFVSAINPKIDDLYQVNILPRTIEIYKSKWPNTDEVMERDYILALVRSNHNIFRNSLKLYQKEFLVELIIKSHNSCKLILEKEREKKTTKSFLSQRDIQRVFKVFNFFFEKFYGEFTDFETDSVILNDPFVKVTLSMMSAIGLCYYLRLNKENRQLLDSKISIIIQKHINELPSNCTSLSALMIYAISTLNKYLEIPTSICRNEALVENMFSLVVCIESMIPVLLLGPPGCSKTLSIQLVTNNMKGTLSKNKFLKQFHALDLFRYQGSKHSSSEEIRKVCEQAKTRQHNYNIKNEKTYALFFFDEAGVPKEEKESLKELHYYLNNPVFPSLLISNDNLDAAKSNRCIEILRSSVESQDLFKLAISILKKNETDKIEDSLETKNQIEHFCSIFSKFFKDSSFFGLRDFYHFLRYIRREVKSDQLGRIQITPDLVVKAVERNLNGFTSSNIFEITKEMLLCFTCETTIDSLLKRMQNIYYNNMSILQDSINDKFRKNREKSCLEDNNVRYIMIIDETSDQSAYRLLLDTEIIDYRQSLNYSLSELEEDKTDIYQTNVISTICAAIESGNFAYLTNTRAIDGSFYDLFNQFFFKANNHYYTTISIGAKSEYKKVHENFQCIVHLNKHALKETPQALLNRFEKFNVSIKDTLHYKLSRLDVKQIELVQNIRQKLLDLVDFIGSINFFSKNIEETIDSLLLSCIVKQNDEYAITTLPALFWQPIDTDSNLLKTILQPLACRLLQLVRPEAIIIKLQKPSNYFSFYIKHYFENLSPMDLNRFIRKLFTQSVKQFNKQIIHLPIDPYLSNNDLFDSNEILCYKVDNFGTEYQLQEKIKDFIEGNFKLLVFSLFYNSNSGLIDQLRRIIDDTNIPSNKVVLLLIHSKSSQFLSPSTKYSIFINNWDILYIDNSSGLSKFDLTSYINSVFFLEPVFENEKQNEITKKNIFSNIERILKQIPIEKLSTNFSIEEIDIEFYKFYTTNSFNTRIDILLKMFTTTHGFLLDGFIKTLNRKMSIEKKKEIIFYHAKQIVIGKTIASLSQNVKLTIEKCLDFTFSNFLRYIISDMGITKLLRTNDRKTIELFVSTFLETFDYRINIDEVFVKENLGIKTIPIRKIGSKLIFSDKLFSSIDTSIQLKISDKSYNFNEESQFTSIANIINDSDELLQYFCYDTALQLFLDDRISQNLVKTLNIVIWKLTENNFNNVTPFTIRETVLKNKSHIESFMITLMNFTENENLLFSSNNFVEILQKNCLNSIENIRSTMYLTVIDSLWNNINNLDKNDLLNALNCISLIKLPETSDENMLKCKTKWEFLVLLNHALSIKGDLQFDKYIIDINNTLDNITINLKEKLYLFNLFISSLENNALLVLTIFNWFKDKDDISSFLMNRICKTNMPSQTKRYLLQKVDPVTVEQYMNEFIKVGPSINCFDKCNNEPLSLFFEWKYKQLKHLKISEIESVIGNIDKNTTLSSERITLVVVDYLIILKASEFFINPLALTEEIDEYIFNRILELLSKDSYKYLFLSNLLVDHTEDEAIDYILENKGKLYKYGKSFEQIISSIAPILFSPSDLPITYQKKHPGFETFQYIKNSLEIIDSNRMQVTEFINSISEKSKTDNNFKWFARTSLTIVGFNNYLVKCKNCSFYNSLINNSLFKRHLGLTNNEILVLDLIFLPEDTHKHFNINIEESFFNNKRSDRSFEQLKLVFNNIAFMFGIPVNNNFYKYLFDHTLILNSFDLTFPDKIINNMDCNSQYSWITPANERARWVPNSLSKTSLTDDVYKLLQFILFSGLSLQTYISTEAFNNYKNNFSSLEPLKGEDGEEMLTQDQKVRNFVWRKQDIPFISFATDLPRNTKLKIICKYLDLLQTFFLSESNNILCNKTFIRSEDTRKAEKVLQQIYIDATKKVTTEELVEDISTSELLTKLQSAKHPTQFEKEITLSVINSKFEEELLNMNKYRIISLYLTKRNLFKYSILIPYCVELYYWIHDTFNGLLRRENLENSMCKLIDTYTSLNTKHGNYIKNIYTEIIDIWNEYIDENGSFGFACNRGAISTKLSMESPILLFIESSNEEPSILLAVIKYLVKLHNDSIELLTAEEKKIELKSVPLHLIKIEHTMFLFTMTEEKFKEIIFSSMVGDMKFDWELIEKSMKREINPLQSHKPKIHIPDEMTFTFREDKETIEFGVYETQIEKRISELATNTKYNQPIEQQYLGILRKHLVTLNYSLITDYFETLFKVIEHCDCKEEENGSVVTTTISTVFYEIDSVFNHLMKNNTQKSFELILDLNINNIGSILLLLLDILKSRDILYCDILELREPLTEEQKDFLKETVETISIENFTSFINGVCSIQNFANEYTTKRARDGISLLEYIEEIDPLNEDDPVRCLLPNHILLEQYVEYHKFLFNIHHHKLSHNDQSLVIDWRDDLESTIDCIQEEEPQTKESKYWFDFKSEEELSDSLAISEESQVAAPYSETQKVLIQNSLHEEVIVLEEE
ncbi:hypothetical protein ABK040_016017 [Willaertia magna]